jgi:hypothetical protein
MAKSKKPHLANCGQILVEALFHAQDREVQRQFQQRLATQSRRQQFAQLCGVHDEALLDHLIALDVPPEAVAALAAIPLVTVAWADWTVQEAERKAILQAAAAAGIAPDNGRYPVLEYWLTRRPKPELLEAWQHYITALCRQLSPEEVATLKHDLLSHARQVAEAAGGILGFGNRVSAQEQAVLERLEQAFAPTDNSDA